jgi:hypothetical protein
MFIHVYSSCCSISSGSLQNIESARLSVPSQIAPDEEKFQWRTNLFKSECFWKGSRTLSLDYI